MFSFRCFSKGPIILATSSISLDHVRRLFSFMCYHPRWRKDIISQISLLMYWVHFLNFFYFRRARRVPAKKLQNWDPMSRRYRMKITIQSFDNPILWIAMGRDADRRSSVVLIYTFCWSFGRTGIKSFFPSNLVRQNLCISICASYFMISMG